MHRNLQKLLGSARPSRGFTLLEIAIVLTIFGIILAGVFILVGQALENQRTNHMSQQIIGLVENTRSYARRVESNTLNLAMIDMCNLGLLPKDIGNTTTCTTGTNYTDALDGTITACAAGGTNTTTCSSSAQASTIAMIAYNVIPADCTTVINDLTNGNTTDLGFTRYLINNTVFLTSTAANLTIINLAANCTPNGAQTPVNLELDFSL